MRLALSFWVSKGSEVFYRQWRKSLKILLAVHPGKPDSMCSELGGRELVLCGQMGELAWVWGKLVRVSIRRHVVGHNIHTGHLVFLLPLHPPILEPDFYLSFSKAKGMCDLDTPSPRQVAVEMELLFQLQGLVPRIRRPLSLRLPIRVNSTCNKIYCVNSKTIESIRFGLNFILKQVFKWLIMTL